MPDNDTIPIPTEYFRFIVVWYEGNKRHQLGILRSVGYVLKSAHITYEDEKTLRGLVQWFNKNLDAPRALNKVAAIFWFKPCVAGTTPCWDNLVAMVNLLRKYRYTVEIVSTPRPGKIVYDDATQIAAVPFNDTYEIGESTPL